jgi:hypothetical protein
MLSEPKAPSADLKCNYKTVLIRYPEGADGWVDAAKATIDCTVQELAKFGVKLAPGITIHLVGSQEEYDRLVSDSGKGGNGRWIAGGDKLITYHGPTVTSAFIIDVARGISGISTYAHQGGQEMTLPQWLIDGIQNWAILANAARVRGVGFNETPEYEASMGRVLNVMDRDDRPAVLQILADKQRNEKSGPNEISINVLVLNSILPFLAPSSLEKGGAAKVKAYGEMFATLVKAEKDGKELNPQELRPVAQTLVKVLKIEEWFKEASKDKANHEVWKSYGLDVNSPEFKAALKDSKIEPPKAGKEDASVPLRYAGGKWAALLEVYFADQAAKTKDHLKSLKTRNVAAAVPVPEKQDGSAKK